MHKGKYVFSQLLDFLDRNNFNYIARDRLCTHCHNAHFSPYFGRCGKGQRKERAPEGLLTRGGRNIPCNKVHFSGEFRSRA